MANNPTLLAMPLAENGQKNTIPVTQAAAGDGLFSQSTGFPPETALPLGAGGVAPKREDFNGAFNVLSDIAFYAQKGWVFKWDAGQAYFKGCEVIDPADGLKYLCIQDVAAGDSVPSADGNHWKITDLSKYLSISDAPMVCTPFAFPSDTWVNIPGTGGTSINYIAPANGFVVAQMSDTPGGNGFLAITSGVTAITVSTTISDALTTILPVRKNATVLIGATKKTIIAARFVYAVGEEP